MIIQNQLALIHNNHDMQDSPAYQIYICDIFISFKGHTQSRRVGIFVENA